MLKSLKFIIVSVVSLLFITACDDTPTPITSNTENPLVYASFYPIYDFSQKAAEGGAEVRCLIPDGTEPHDWEPSPKDIAELGKADIFVYSSENLEPWAKSVLADLKNDRIVSLETSVYSAYYGEDPHTWLSPVEAKLQFTAICDALISADPKNSGVYAANQERWVQEFNKLDEEFSELLLLPRKKILVTHAAFGHLCAAYGLEQISVTEGSAEYEPDPARMAEIIAVARENSISAVFFEEISGAKLANAIAAEIGGEAYPLSPLECLTEEQRKNGDDYFSVMRKNLAVLKEALM